VLPAVDASLDRETYSLAIVWDLQVKKLQRAATGP
jgi:hypothetical protein